MKKVRKLYRYIASIIVGIAMAIVILSMVAMPVLGATTADVTISAQGKYVSFSCNASDYDFGLVDTSSTTNTTGTWALFTNTSSISTNTSVRMLADTWTSSGTGWTHSDSAAGANTAAVKANSSNDTTWGTNVFVKYNAPFNEIQSDVEANSNFLSGLSLLAPTSLDDGYANNNTVRFTIYASS